MERITLCDHNGDFIGWFDLHAATMVASKSLKGTGGLVHGKILLKTKGGRLVVNEWDNSGGDWYYFPEESEVADILADGDYKKDKALLEMLEKYEV